VHQSHKPPLRVVLLGYGAINQRVAEFLLARRSRVAIVGVIVSGRGVRRPMPHGASVVMSPDELEELSPDIVLEAASCDAVHEWGASALRSASRLAISSASALADDRFFQLLRETARRVGSQLVVSPGAIAGVDALAAVARLPIDEVRHRIVKPPNRWASSASNPPPTHRKVVFCGSAREAARLYPRNANVAVVSALATKGLDDTIVELIADPAAVSNRHEIAVTGDFGSIVIKIDNAALTANPRSSALAALALVRIAANEVADVVV
jgi:aspartate dehydrogenase